MQPTANQQRDKFEQHLDGMIIKLHNCQTEKNMSTCSKCEFYFSCEIRTDYVKAVYNSMSKGDTGGFEF